MNKIKHCAHSAYPQYSIIFDRLPFFADVEAIKIRFVTKDMIVKELVIRG